MSDQSMEDFFRMVGFDPEENAAKAAKAASETGESQASRQGAPASGPGGAKGGHAGGGKQVNWGDVFKEMGNRGQRRRGGRWTSHPAGSEGADAPRFVWANSPFRDWSKKKWVLALLVLILILAFCYWWFHPPINIHSTEFWMCLLCLVVLPAFVGFRTISWRASKKKDSAGKPAAAGKAKAYRLASYIPLAVAAFFMVGTFAMWSFWPGNAHRYATILNVQDCDFATDISQVDYDSIPVIDRSSAIILGNRTLGEIPDYVSQFEISNVYSQINYQGRPVRVSPLNYADIFKWFTNMQNGIPAYVLVDMASQDTKIVRLDNPVHYVESDPLFKNIDRYVQLKYPFYFFDEKAFEIDEDGTPWWVCPVQTRTIGLFGGETITRVVLVNASSGECVDYAIEDCPQWVDRAYPSSLLVQQFNWRGLYSNGWLNSLIGQAGVVQTTPGSDGLPGYNYIAKDDDVWVYTGVTSATADDAIVGFVLANQRTAEAHYYSVAGATEASAMASAEGQVQNLKYDATFPLLLNIDGQPTYFMALKDSAGLVKKFAMLDIQRYQNVAVGDTVSECQKSYESLLATNGALTGDGTGTDAVKSVTGSIAVMTEAVIEGNSHFYLTLSDSDLIFDCALPAQIEVVAYQVGDNITLNYVESSPTCSVESIGAKDTSSASGSATGESGGSGTSAAAGNSGAGSDAGEGTSTVGVSASSSSSSA